MFIACRVSAGRTPPLSAPRVIEYIQDISSSRPSHSQSLFDHISCSFLQVSSLSTALSAPPPKREQPSIVLCRPQFTLVISFLVSLTPAAPQLLDSDQAQSIHSRTDQIARGMVRQLARSHLLTVKQRGINDDGLEWLTDCR